MERWRTTEPEDVQLSAVHTNVVDSPYFSHGRDYPLLLSLDGDKTLLQPTKLRDMLIRFHAKRLDFDPETVH